MEVRLMSLGNLCSEAMKGTLIDTSLGEARSCSCVFCKVI